MPNIKDLIEKLCPDGVEYKSIREVCDFVQGFAFKNNTFKQEGVGLVRTTNIQDKTVSKDNMVYIDFEDYKENLSKYIIKKDKILIGMSGTIKVGINNNNEEYLLNQRVGMFIPYEDIINNRFLFYILDNSVEELYNLVSGSSVKNLSSKVLNEYKIAVPPLEVQCKIVHILDDFTLLSAELSAELKARQKQYEFYRDKLLYLDEKIPRRKLIDVSSISRGKRVTKKDLNENNEFPVYQNSLAPMGYYKDYNYEKNKTYIISAGAAGKIGFCKENFWAADDCLVVYNLKEVLDKYVYYYLLVKQDYIKANVRKASIPRLSREIIKNIEIPIPSLERQEEIVNILDKLDKLCNDISEGLPAEIEARQKQYEYYRDKLLTFKELKVNE